MKNLKKIMALALAVVMVLALSVSAFAASGGIGGTGSITVLNATKGHTYTAYKVFDASFDGTKVSYKVESSLVGKVSTTLFNISTAAETIGTGESAKQYYTVSPKDGVTDAQIIAWVKEAYEDFDSTGTAGAFDATNSTVTFSDIPYGYYYITSSLGTTITIDSAVPSQTVYDKNEVAPVAPVKTITAVDGEALTSELSKTDAHVGSVISFKVTAKTTNWYKDGTNADGTDKWVLRDKWDIADAATNMFVDPETIVVKVNGDEISDFTAAGDGNGGFTLSIPMKDTNGNSIYAAPADGLIPIEITYDATILEEAASAPAKNEIGPSKVEVDTYAFMVEKYQKVDGSDAILEGAEFELWSAKGTEGAAAALTFIDNKDGTYTYYEKTSEADTTEVTSTLQVLKKTVDGTDYTQIVIKGLDNKWSYTLKETKVPAGYNQAADITIAGSSLTKVEKTSADGVEPETYTDTTVASTALYTERVLNQQGAVLPTTGGIGTTIFSVVGGILMIGALILFVSNRRTVEAE